MELSQKLSVPSLCGKWIGRIWIFIKGWIKDGYQVCFETATQNPWLLLPDLDYKFGNA